MVPSFCECPRVPLDRSRASRRHSRLLLADGQAGDEEDGRALGALRARLGGGVEPGGRERLSCRSPPAADDDKAVATKTIEVPVAGKYFVWVRYGDWREKTERFQIHLEQPGRPRLDRQLRREAGDRRRQRDEALLGLGLRLGHAAATELTKGPATLKLAFDDEGAPAAADRRDRADDRRRLSPADQGPAAERRLGAARRLSRRQIPADLEPLARRRPTSSSRRRELPPAWKLKTLRDKGFLYLWNVSHTNAGRNVAERQARPREVPVQHRRRRDVRTEFEKKYAGRDDVPIFSDPRIVPTFHGVGPGIFATDAKTGEVNDAGQALRPLARREPRPHLGHDDELSPRRARSARRGSPCSRSIATATSARSPARASAISTPDAAKMQAADRRRQDAAAAGRGVHAATRSSSNREKYRKVYRHAISTRIRISDVISCLSVGNIVFAPLCGRLGRADDRLRIVGTATSSILGMRWAFMRGAARQHGHSTATYRSCNFGDQLDDLQPTQPRYTTPQNILDNYYSVFSGAGMTWYKFDIWYQYMAGSSMFYHEQGFDEFWQPGGTTAAGMHEVQLSPKGKLVDRFLRVTAAEPDRGAPVSRRSRSSSITPTAGSRRRSGRTASRTGTSTRSGSCSAITRRCWRSTSGPPSTRSAARARSRSPATNEVYVPGVFGDMFDVIFAYPDANKWKTIDTLSRGDRRRRHRADRGRRDSGWRSMSNSGGTLLVADAHLTGPGVAALNLPATGAPTRGRRLSLAGRAARCSRRSSSASRDPAAGAEPLRPLATTPDGKVLLRRDRPRRGPAHLSVGAARPGHRPGRPSRSCRGSSPTSRRGLMPVEVHGDVEWLRQSHANRLAGHAAQSRRPGQAAARHHADRLSPEPPDHDHLATSPSPPPATACCRMIH